MSDSVELSDDARKLLLRVHADAIHRVLLNDNELDSVDDLDELGFTEDDPWGWVELNAAGIVEAERILAEQKSSAGSESEGKDNGL